MFLRSLSTLLLAATSPATAAQRECGPGGRYLVLATTPLTVTLPVAVETGRSWQQTTTGAWRRLPHVTCRGGVTTIRFSSRELLGGKTSLVLNKPPWLDLDDGSPPRIVELRVDGLRRKPARELDLGWLDKPPRRLEAHIRDDRNPLDPASVRLVLNGAVVPPGTPGLRFARNPADPRSGRLRCFLDKLTVRKSLGTTHLRLEFDDFAPDDKKTGIDIVYTVTNPPTIRPGEPAAVAPSGVEVYVDSVCPGYNNIECVVDGKAQIPGTTTFGCTWPSAVTPRDHWICLVLPRRRSLSGVKLDWANWNRTWWTSRRYEILTWQGGRWRAAVRVHGNPAAPASVHRFAPRTTDRLLVWQPAGGGHPEYENIFWLAELTLLP